jgi:nucleoid DNA-binding protein
LSQKLQLSELEIKSVLDVYWDKIRKNLSSLENNHVYLKGLGTFYMRASSVDKQLKMNENIINKYTQNPTAGGLAIINGVLKDNLKLTDARERLKEESIKKENIKYERRNQNLEGEEQDS